jgi:hypothetical protein
LVQAAEAEAEEVPQVQVPHQEEEAVEAVRGIKLWPMLDILLVHKL